MKKFKLSKLNIVTLAVVACMAIVIATTQGTIAFFTDAKQETNVFTAGNVYISLSEAAVKSDGAGNLIEDTSLPRIEGNDISDANVVINDYGKIFPGQTIYKDPTITNTGDDAAWVAAKIIITDGVGDISKLFGVPGYDILSIRGDLLDGGLLGESAHFGTWNGVANVVHNDKYAMVSISDHPQGKYEFYIYVLDPLQKGESVTLFDTMVVNELFGNAEMRELSQLNITIQAFAVQKFGFNDSHSAMHRAFEDHFKVQANH